MTDTATESSDSPTMQCATIMERYLNGLMNAKKLSRRNVRVEHVSGRGRSAFAAKNFNAGDFVCEYAAEVREKEDPDIQEQMIAALGLGCYCLDATYGGKKYTFDASSKCNDPGRYINHAAKNCNLILKQPLMIKGKLKIGLVARSFIRKGDEIFFDYGIRDKDIPWLKTDAKEVGITIDQGIDTYIILSAFLILAIYIIM